MTASLAPPAWWRPRNERAWPEIAITVPPARSGIIPDESAVRSPTNWITFAQPFFDPPCPSNEAVVDLRLILHLP